MNIRRLASMVGTPRNARGSTSVFFNVGGRPLDTFTLATAEGFTATKTQTALDARCGIDNMQMVAGRRYRVEFYMNVNSGTVPWLDIRASALTGTILTLSVTLTPGYNRFDFTNPALGAAVVFNWSQAAWLFNGSVSKFRVTGR
jgi:hypothetical protein